VRVCGIDPGSKGAMCVLDSSKSTHLAILDLDKATIYDATRWLHQQAVDIIYLEDVHSLYGMSAKSNFTFGKMLGIVITMSHIVTRGNPPVFVTPKVWQKFIGIAVQGKAIKTEVAKIAAKHYPKADLYGPRGGLKDGRADALMLAHYGMHHKEP